MSSEPVQLGYAGALDEMLVIEEADGTITCTAPLNAGNGPRPAVMWVTLSALMVAVLYAISWLSDVLGDPIGLGRAMPYLLGIPTQIAKPIMLGVSMGCFIAACFQVLKRRRDPDAVVQLILTPSQLILNDPTRSTVTSRWFRSEIVGFQCFKRRRDLRWRRIADLQVFLRDRRRIALLRHVPERELEAVCVRLCNEDAPTQREPSASS